MVTHIRSTDFSGYRHNYDGFCIRLTYLMFINKWRTASTHIPSVHVNLVEILSFFLFLF